MKKLFFAIAAAGLVSAATAQNAGIRISNPAFPLTVGADGANNSIVQKGNGVEAGFSSTANAGIFKTLTNHHLHFATNNSTVPSMTLSSAGNVGIGLAGGIPAYKLDIEGRIRIQQNTATAGIYFDGTATEARSFFGTLTDDYTGFWGGGGGGWSFVMNVNNGNIGIGTTAPTAKLDVNGSLRIQTFNASTGSVFTSKDANGNADWMEPAAFRAQGSSTGGSASIPGGVWTKYFFSTTTAYNAGLHYQPVLSQFVAPVRGIYHFSAKTGWLNRHYTTGIGLEGTRNGISIADLPEYIHSNGRSEYNGVYYPWVKANIETLSADVNLEAGDIIWLKVYRDAADLISADPNVTWFTGRLVTAY